MPHFFVIALATLVTEDLTCIATGVLVAERRLDFWSGTLACVAGIYFGDVLLFLAGRFAGRSAIRWPLFRRFLPPEKIDRASEWLSAKGASVVLLSRFAPGLRLPTYFAAGLLRTRFWRFATYFLIAAAIWTPLLVGLTVVVGGPAVRSVLLTEGKGFVAALVLGFGLRKALLDFRIRRRILGRLLRIARWEFWPLWAAYLPLIPYLLWLAVKHRSLTIFMLANPGMPSGGFVGESKSQILGHLSRVPGAVAAYTVIPAALKAADRFRKAGVFLEQRGLNFPVVLKPDVGQRGSGVAIIRSEQELESYLRLAIVDTILQEYIDGPEFGVFYCRYPNEPSGHITSITEKHFPEVIGDGQSTIEELILRDSRAVCLARAYLSRLKRPANSIPARGERVRLAELGSHCRGSVFVDGRRLITPALEAAIDRISKSHPGFYFGRFDIRARSVESFQAGEEFKVLELNGVSAEATHIYDPTISLGEAYRTMFQQWRVAFEIGAEHHRRDASPAA